MSAVLVERQGVAGMAAYCVSATVFQTSLIGIAMIVSILSHAFCVREWLPKVDLPRG
jgi:hypothetical protein